MDETITLQSLAKMIDHSLLHPTMTDEVIAAGCELAVRYQVATACVKPYAISLARSILGWVRGRSVRGDRLSARQQHPRD